MIREIKGNLISMCETGELPAMVHGCNCLHMMGSGIAGQLARRYPEVPKADIRDSKYGDFSKIGDFTEAQCESVTNEGVVFYVYNAYTQKIPSYDGHDVFEYESFPVLLGKIVRDIEWHVGGGQTEGWSYEIGFPQIGAGLAGGDWPRIRQMIVDAFEAHPNITAVLVEYQP